MEGLPESAKEMLARVDERTRTILEDFKEMRNDLKNHIAFFEKTIEEQDLKLDILKKETSLKFDSLKKDFDVVYVRKESFSPVQRLVYGFIGLVLIAFAGAIISPIFVSKTTNPSTEVPKSIK